MTLSLFTTAPGLSFEVICLIAAAGILSLPAMYAVHLTVNHCCLRHARKFCREHGFVIGRWRNGPEDDLSGTKTEFTQAELDCMDGVEQRRLIRLSVGLSGIRKVITNETFQDAD